MDVFTARTRVKKTVVLLIGAALFISGTAFAQSSKGTGPIMVEGDQVLPQVDASQIGDPFPTPDPASTGEDDHDLDDEALAKLTANEPRFVAPADLHVFAVASNIGGAWGPVITWPHTPVSMANLPDGRILTWSGSEREHWPTTEQTYSAVFDPQTSTFEEFFYEGHNMFCSDLISLEDGRIMALGGRNTVELTSIFDFSTETWTPVESMNTSRWYPTSMLLGNGDVFTAVGKGGRYPERYTVGKGWTLLTGADLQGPILDYGANKDGAGWWPLMHLDPRGNVFHYGATPQMHSIDPTGIGSVTPLGPNNFNWFPEEAVAIMYDEGKILVAGGAIDNANNLSSSNASIIDITGVTPVITSISPMNFPRQFSNEVMLPGGQVLVIGGNTSGMKFSDNGTVLDAELWDPETQAWTLMNPMDVPRNYHSTAILLPDGRVLAAGGGYASGDPNHPATHTDGQIFSPPYLFNPDGSLAARPQITIAPAKISSGEQFNVQASADTAAFSLVRMSSTTHTMNPGQMFLDVPFTGGAGSFQLTAHSNPNVLVPGYWMLFALNETGVPSEAHIIHVNSSGKPWIINPDDQSGLVGLATTLLLQAGDTDGDTLTFSATGLPSGLSINNGTGDISGIPDTEGVHNVTVTVSDTNGHSRDTTFSWTIFGAGQGQIVREWWNGIAGTDILSLTNDPDFPDNPSGAEVLPSFEGPVNWADNYGSRIYGHLTPLVTGNYTFWISSDDNGELWLSSDDDPANATLIASVPSWSSSREWTKFPEQQSVSIPLVANQKYYIEALMNEGSGGDNLAVAWEIPGQTGPTVIDGAYLSPYQPPQPDPLTLNPLTSAPQLVSTAITYTAVSNGGSGIVLYKWSFGDGSPETTYSSSPTMTYTYAQPGRYLVTLTAVDDTAVEQSVQFIQAVHNAPTANRPVHSSSIVYEERSGNDRVWNVNPDNNSVAVVDEVTDTQITEIPVGLNPQTLAIAPNGRIWVANADSASISIIDQATLTVLNNINLPHGSQPYGLVFSPSGDFGYVALEETGVVLKLDPATAAVLDSLNVGPNPRHLAVTHDGSELYLSRFITPLLPGEATATVQTSGVGGELLTIDTATFTVGNTIILQVDDGSDFEAGARGVPNYLGAMVIAPDGLTAWVPSKEDNILRGQLRDGLDLNFEHTVRAISSLVDMTTGQEDFIFRLDYDNSSVSSAAAFGPYGNYLFVALETSREIAIVDGYSKAELFRFDTGIAPQGVVVSPDGAKLFVHNFMDRSVGIYNVNDLINHGLLTVSTSGVLNVVSSELLASDVLLGKQFFYDAADPRLALDGYMSCASCHNEGASDGRVWDFTGFGEGLRSTISLEGRGGPDHGPLHWTANFNEVHDFEGQIRTFAGGTGLMSDPDFNATSDPLGADKTGMSADLDALAAYVNSLTSVGHSPFRNADGTLTADGAAGQVLFLTNSCATCHSGGGFTDSPSLVLHDIGTISATSGSRISGPLTGLDTPTLRGLWATGPYLHDGSAATLADAVLAHNGVSISGLELDQLISYLNQIDDSEPAPSPPSVTITSPVDGATISGVVNITANASDDNGVTQVEFFVDGNSIGVDTTAPYAADWNSTTVGDGSHTISAVATDTVGQTGSDVNGVNVDNLPDPTVHVGNLDASGSEAPRGRWNATVTITVHDNNENPVAGATVDGDWSNGASGSQSCVTDGGGQCTITKNNLKSNISTVDFTITNVTSTVGIYMAGSNHDPDGGSNGTTLTVFSPGANDAPTVAINNPAAGSILSSGASISFSGSANDVEDGNLTSSLVWTSNVDGQIGTGGSFNAVLSDGTHTITASVTDSGGASGSDAVGITVGMVSTVVMHVGDLDGSSAPAPRNRWSATVTIQVHDAGEGPVDNATVSGSWSVGSGGSCTTDGAGICSITNNNIKGNDSSAVFTVSEITRNAGDTYNSGANHDPDGDSNGTSVTILIP